MSSSEQNLETGEITKLLQRIGSGETQAQEQLFELIYDHFKQIARRQLRKERNRNELWTTEVVNEACLKLANDGFAVTLDNRRHLFGAAFRAIKQVLVDYARKRKAQKRGQPTVPLLDDILEKLETSAQTGFLELQVAMEDLRMSHPCVADVVEARFYSGLTIPATAEFLEISVDKVKRNWRFGKAFLHSRIVQS